MWLTQLIRGLRYSGYDRRGNLKYLLGRAADPAMCDVSGVPPDVRDEALALLCESFDIPEQQMHCLRPGDELMAIYRSIVGPRFWDDMELERTRMAIDELPGPKLTDEEAQAVATVADLVRVVAARRG